MGSTGGSTNFSGKLLAEKIRTQKGATMPTRTTYTPVKTNADLINDLCKTYGLKYVIDSSGERVKIHFTDREGVIVTGIGVGIREAITDAAPKLGVGK